MSTINRHTLKKAQQARRNRAVAPENSPRRPRSPLRPVLRSGRRLARKPWIWLALLILLASLGLGTWYYTSRGPAAVPSISQKTSSQPATQPAGAAATATQTPVQNWQTLRTFTGSLTGSNNTPLKLQKFTATSPWQISWNCQGLKGVDDFLYIAIYNADGTLYNAGAQVTCVAVQPVNGSVQENKPGDFYLTVDSDTDWTITVQVAAPS